MLSGQSRSILLNHEYGFPKMTRNFTAVATVVVAYVIACVVAIATGFLVRHLHPIAIAAIADAAATMVIFAFSFLYKNSSFYDPYWSVAPIALVAYWALLPAAQGADHTRQTVVAVLVAAWGLRLTYNWYRGWQGLRHEDWRYLDLQEQHGRAYWLVSFSGIHMFPTILVFLGCIPVYYALTSDLRAFGALDIAATVITAGAIIIEATADQQLRRFVTGPHVPGGLLTTGLWKYSRHPNYFGEISFWWGLFVFALAANPSKEWPIAGPVSMTILFVFISIPMIEKRHLERKPLYHAYMHSTSFLIPWFPNKGEDE